MLRPVTFKTQCRLVLAAAVALVVAGCVTPPRAKRDADRAAYRIVKEKQQAALGRTEDFTLETPENQLRRRLMLDQKLPAGGAASYGRPYLPAVPKEPAGVSPNHPLPEEAVVIPTATARTRGVGTETLATDVFLMEIGRDPGSGAVPGRPARQPPVVIGPPAPTEMPPEPLVISLIDALQIGARSSRDYQAQKEDVFLAALDLDLERDDFEFRFSGTLDTDFALETEGEDTAGLVVSPALGVTKLFKSGARLTTRIGLDLAKLLTGNRGESLGTFADASITIPLLRGAGVEVVTENLHQAERDAVYAIWEFESFKRDFAVDIVGEYLGILGDLQSIENSLRNYQSAQDAAVLAAALYREGRLPGIQVSQATQNALQAQERLLLARQRYDSRIDSFKIRLGLPPDASIALQPAELERLMPLAEAVLGPEAMDVPALERRDPATQPGNGRPLGPEVEPPATQPQTQPDRPGTQPSTIPAEVAPADPEAEAVVGGIDPEQAAYYAWLAEEGIRLALQHRLDLAVTYGRVFDAQRRTVVAANALQAGLDLTGSAAYGGSRGPLSGGQPDTDLRLGDGSYGAGVALDLPIERTAERNSYRVSIINLDRAVRAAQQLEDQVKLDVLNRVRDLQVSAEDLRIQAVSTRVAEHQVNAARRFLELGRGQVRDLTEAQDDLINAQNAFTAALVDYRLAQLQLQRDLGILQVDAQGLFDEADIMQPAP